MSDVDIRRLERRILEGDTGAQNALAIAYARSGKFSIEEHDTFYRLHNLEQHESICTVDWKKTMVTTNQFKVSQHHWIEHFQDQEWQLPSSPLCVTTITTLYEHQNGAQHELIEKIRTGFEECFHYRIGGILTSTRIEFKENTLQKIIHWYKNKEKEYEISYTHNSYSIQEHEGLIETVNEPFHDHFTELFAAICGTNNVNLFLSSLKWILNQPQHASWHYILTANQYLWVGGDQGTQDETCAVVIKGTDPLVIKSSHDVSYGNKSVQAVRLPKL